MKQQIYCPETAVCLIKSFKFKQEQLHNITFFKFSAKKATKALSHKGAPGYVAVKRVASLFMHFTKAKKAISHERVQSDCARKKGVFLFVLLSALESS
jgi:tRNA A37 methylthiotransferase MiaB